VVHGGGLDVRLRRSSRRFMWIGTGAGRLTDGLTSTLRNVIPLES
jgi:hypothetical protein